jgi:DNA-binding MarR family transcriptional regulator
MSRQQSEYTRQILEAISTDERVTQRSIASRMNVALGLTNLLIRRLVRQGYVRVSRMNSRHVRYLMTPSGWDALARATRQSLENTVHLYTQTREQIRHSLAHVSQLCPTDGSGAKRVVFYGAGDVAEIAYASLQATDLLLIGVIDDRREGRFFHLEIARSESLSDGQFQGVPYGHVVVTALHDADAIRATLTARQVPSERIFCL